MSSAAARLALVAASLAAAGAGWYGATLLADDDAAGTVVAAVDLFDCPSSGNVSVGQVNGGDKVWLIGVTDDRWAVIRHPDAPDRPAWVPLAMVATDASAGDLPQLSCADAVDATGNNSPGSTAPPTSVGGGVPSSMVLATSTTSSTTSTTSTTIAVDLIPPTVTVTADRAHLYVLTGSFPCSFETALEVTIVVADSSVPLSIRSIVADWNAPAGPQTANLVPISGNRFLLQIAANGPVGGETPLTLTATGSDGAGNIGLGQLVVSLRDPAAFGCP